MKNAKRILAVVLSLAIAAGVLVTTALAAGTMVLSAVGGAAEGERLDCVYLVRPAARTAEGEDAPLALPEEFVELAAAKLRGEACRLAGEDALCAKWFSDYNAKLESFAAWCDRRRGGAA